MNNSEIIGLTFILVFYVIVGGIIARKNYVSIGYDPAYLLKFEKIISDEALDYIRSHKFGISWVCGMLWVFYGIFVIWSDIGNDIYEEIIIDKDEESRIAAWLF